MVYGGLHLTDKPIPGGSATTATPRLYRLGILAARIVLFLAILEIASIAVLSWHEGRILTPGEPVGDLETLAAVHKAGENLSTCSYGDPSIVVHPYLGYVRNASETGAAADRLGALPVSEFGFEDDKVPLLRRSEDRLIVGFFGGSVANRFSAGTGGQALREHLQALVPDREVVLVHVALDGYKQPQQLMALTYLLALGGEFDAVVNLDGFNEVALAQTRNVDLGVSHAFPRDWSLLVEELPDNLSTAAVGEIVWLRQRRGAWARRFEDGLAGCSATAQLVWLVRDRAMARDIDGHLHAYSVQQTGDPWSPTKGPRDHHVDGELPVELVDLWTRSSFLMDKVCRENGIVYLHFLQPNQYVAGVNVVGPRSGAAAIHTDHPLRSAAEAGYPLLIRAGVELARGGVEFEDLTGVFTEVEEQVYCDSCCHLNDLGNGAIEARIFAALARHISPS